METTPLLGICADLESSPTVQQAGADFLEVNAQHFLVPAAGDADFLPRREAAARLAVPIRSANCFLPAGLPCVGPAVDEAALLEYARNTFSRAAETGIRCLVFGSGGARNVPAGFPVARAREQFVRLLQQLAPLAERASVTITVEPLNPNECNFLHTLAEGAKIVEACRHEHIRLLADTYHMGFSGEGPEVIRQHGKYLRHFHIADCPSRHFPGADGSSYRSYFEALRETGYPGAISMECRWDDFAGEATRAVANVRRDLAAAGYAAASF